LLTLLCVSGLTCLRAQTSSVIKGTLTDPQGKAIVGAVISLSGSGLVGETQFLSDASGSYRLTGLPAGTYNLRVSKPGFAIKVYTGLTVAVNRVVTMDVALVLGSTLDEVTVTAMMPLIFLRAAAHFGANAIPAETAGP
jgi:hypothetical protein